MDGNVVENHEAYRNQLVNLAEIRLLALKFLTKYLKLNLSKSHPDFNCMGDDARPVTPREVLGLILRANTTGVRGR